MSEQSYLQWLSGETATTWWNDSADHSDIALAMDHGAVGVTTNPVLTYKALCENKSGWAKEIEEALQANSNGDKAVGLTGVVVKKASDILLPIFHETKKNSGYVCSQVNPALAGNREVMLETAIKMSQFNENVSVKLPATAAGLDVMEECIAEGINITITVSFTLPQVLAAAERNRRGRKRAEANGKRAGKCFAVVMIGRLDDYIKDIAIDRRADVSTEDIQNAGLAVVKRAYEIYEKEEYTAELMIAAMRGSYHITELAGAKMIMSIHPKHQTPLLGTSQPKEEMIEKPVDPSSIERLMTIPEFQRAYEPDLMKPEEFLSYGAEQRTLTQFSEVGWKNLESFNL